MVTVSGPIATAADASAMARHLYATAPRLQRILARYRPYIAPFEALVEAVPPGARVLDIGCGSGLFLALLAGSGRIAGGCGFDSSAAAIDVAQLMAERLPSSHGLDFRCLGAEAPWPEGHFDVVSLIDVIHHIDPRFQCDVIARAARRLEPGGLLLYKDMGERPRGMAIANRLHDLVLARQWINYLPIQEAQRVIEAEGLETMNTDATSRLWYRHETIVARRVGM